MNAMIQFLDFKGRKAFAVLPIDEYERLIADGEDARDLAAAIAADKTESLPAAIAERIISGESALRVYRDHRGLTQAALASRCGVRQDTISRIEARTIKGSVDTLAALAEGLGVTIDDLVD